MPVRDIAALSRVKMHPDAWLRAVEKAKLLGALVCASDGDVVHARFAGVAGVTEEVGWGLTAAQPFDLFPQTRHLECVLALQRG